MISDADMLERLHKQCRLWRRLFVLSAAAMAVFLIALIAAFHSAQQTLGTHWNLYYLMWKGGLRPYEQAVALSGLFHDRELQKRMIGMSKDSFEKTFPNTFFKVRTPPPASRPGQEYFVSSYEQSISEDGRLVLVWVAIFEEGRLVEFDFSKGV